MTAFSTNPAPTRRGCLSKKLNALPPMNEFQWLLVLGFPAEIAAATVMPEVFIAADDTFEQSASQPLAA
jgi:hypothetical protein